jgi:hypothetical protein
MLSVANRPNSSSFVMLNVMLNVANKTVILSVITLLG